ncbi:MAG: hypothetical protein GY853_14590 [PVC group bacterium]|nr:hypothetical protein [PVC group bacterium]
MSIVFPIPGGTSTLQDDPANIHTYIAHMEKNDNVYKHRIEIYPRADAGAYGKSQIILPRDVIMNDVTENGFDKIPFGASDTAKGTIQINMLKLKTIAFDKMTVGIATSDTTLYDLGLALEELRQYLLNPVIFADYTFDFSSDGFSNCAGSYTIQVYNTFAIFDDFNGTYGNLAAEDIGIWPIGIYSQVAEIPQKNSTPLEENIVIYDIINAAVYACKNISYEHIMQKNNYTFKPGIREYDLNSIDICNFLLDSSRYRSNNDTPEIGAAETRIYWTTLSDHAELPFLAMLDIMNTMCVHSEYSIESHQTKFDSYDYHYWFEQVDINNSIGHMNPLAPIDRITSDLYFISKIENSANINEIVGGFYFETATKSIYDYDNYYELLKEETTSIGAMSAFHYSRNTPAPPELGKIYISYTANAIDYSQSNDIKNIEVNKDYLVTGYHYLTKAICKWSGVSNQQDKEVTTELRASINGQTENIETIFHNCMNNNITSQTFIDPIRRKFDNRADFESLQLVYFDGDNIMLPHPYVRLNTFPAWLNNSADNGVYSDKYMYGLDMEQLNESYWFSPSDASANNEDNISEAVKKSRFYKYRWGLRLASINKYWCYPSALAFMLVSTFSRNNQAVMTGAISDVKFGYTENFTGTELDITDSTGVFDETKVSISNTQIMLSGKTDWGNRTTEFRTFIFGDTGDDFEKKFGYPVYP